MRLRSNSSILLGIICIVAGAFVACGGQNTGAVAPAFTKLGVTPSPLPTASSDPDPTPTPHHSPSPHASSNPDPDPTNTPHPTPTPTASSSGALFDHVTIVMMENHSYNSIIGSSSAPYINSLAATGTLFTDSHAISHPSLPNYLAIFSGSTQGVADDGCSYLFSGPNLASELIAKGYSFGGYAEDLPSSGARSCDTGLYGQRHVPEAYFDNTPGVRDYSGSLPASMPTVLFLTPNVCDDMHDCSVAHGDAWLASNLPQILAYDALHNGLLILTWDEDDHYSGNHIATILVGPMVTAGTSNQSINHYSVLRTVTDNFGLPALNNAARINGIWH